MERTGARPAWVVAGLGLAVAAGVAVAVLRGGVASRADEPAAEEPAPVSAPLVTEAPAAQASAGPGTPVLATNSANAIGALRAALGKARVYAQLAPDGDRLELRSGSCEEARFTALLDEFRATLQQAGFRRVRCLQPHGQVVFERDL